MECGRPFKLTCKKDTSHSHVMSKMSLMAVSTGSCFLSRFLKKNVALWGLWLGKGKPVMHAFLKPLVIALNSISKNGITVTVEKERFPVHIHYFLRWICKQSPIGCFWYHNGDCGCSTCNIKSVTVKSGKGHSKAYLFEDYKTTTQRTAESFRQDAELANET